MAATVPTYRRRLFVEGLNLAAWGLLMALGLLTVFPAAHAHRTATVAQLLGVVIVFTGLGIRAIGRWTRAAVERGPDQVSGAPAAGWKFPAVVIAGTVGAAIPFGWPAAVAWALSCAVVGLVQGLVLAPYVRHLELRDGCAYFRMAGSRLLATKLARVSRAGDRPLTK